MSNQVAIAIGLVLGLGYGIVASVSGSPELQRFAEIISPIGTAFVNLVRMVVIPLVATTVFVGVSSLSDPRRLSRLGIVTLAFFWITSFLAIGIGMLVMKLALFLAPVTVVAAPADEAARELPTAIEFIVGLIPSNPFAAAAEGALLPLILFTVLFGAAVGTLPDSQKEILVAPANAITTALIKLILWILWIAPIGVFALAASLATAGGLSILRGVIAFVLSVAVGLAILVGVIILPAVRILGKTSVRTFLRAAASPFAIGASATSSPAALPALFDSARTQLHISPPVSSLVLSVGVSINRPGSALFQGAAIVFLAALYGVSLSGGQIGAAVIATFLVSLTVAGVPSASVVTITPALQTVGIPLAGLAVLFGIDRIPDMLRSGVNVMAHLAAATVVDRLHGGALVLDDEGHQLADRR
jgi:Na+/H+-dicarboxylate symporter